jgi:uncharacterized protein (DUF697 family)
MLVATEKESMTMNEQYEDTEFLEGEEQEYGQGENEFGFELDELESGDDREIELAAELLSVSNERELDQFLGGFLRKIGRTAQGIINTPAGQQLKGLLRKTAKKALPLAGKAVGGYIGGSKGADVGGYLGNAAGRLFNLELEGMSPEDQEFEVARRFVRLADDAAQRVASAPQNGNPRQIATSALVAAARKHAPGLVPRGNGNGNGGASVTAVRQRPGAGRWVRRGRGIVLVNVF